MTSSISSERNDYVQQTRDETRRRDRLTRSLKLLRSVRDALQSGDPVPTVRELVAVTGLPHPGTDAPAAAVDALIAAAEAERSAANRRLRLARALRGAEQTVEEEDTAEIIPPAAPSPLADEASRLSRISARDLDRLPYGAILMDSNGRIIAYNDTESRMARLPVEAVLGRNFFAEVAPCTRVKEFEGRFRSLAAGEGSQVTTFDFTFPFPFGAQHVSVILTRGAAPGTVIMALLRR